jgi:dienelactone hydrolase
VGLLLLPAAMRAVAESATNGVAPDMAGFADYFKTETAQISGACLSNIDSLADWEARRGELRRQAAEMLGLDPMPERTPLHAVITGKLEEKDFTVEKIYFQSQPHLYVTADLYLPKPLSNSMPTVLYLCGHLPVITNGVSYGNKTAYQHHGIWFARNGYVCLVVDTLQYGEIPGHHRGTYDEDQWWWNSRGYTPAGVETWNAIRALDYLNSRPEVDTNRIGVTGRSGGGAYSWFLAAVDDRVKVVAPVAGITDLQNYAVDGKVDEHCDCMFLVNTHRWDYPLLAALCAPRPLLLANTDTDQFFPLDGVLRTRSFIKHIYDLYGAATNFGLVIGPGPHLDTQNLQVPVFRWFNLYFKHADPPIEMAAVKMFSPQQLKVFDKIPDDQINTVIQDSFVPAAPPAAIPTTAADWENLQATWTNSLRQKCFAGWPAEPGPVPVRRLASEIADGIRCETYEIQSQPDVTLRIYLMRKADTEKPASLFLHVTGNPLTNVPPVDFSNDIGSSGIFGTTEAVKRMSREIKERNTAYAVFFPRGAGPDEDDKPLRRRFMLVGQTLDGMRVWDICRAVGAIRSLPEFEETHVGLEAEKNMGVNVLYASLFEPGINSLRLRGIPASQQDGPDYLNVLKILDIPEAAAMAAEHCNLQLQSGPTNNWNFLRAMAASPAAHLKVEWMK